MVMGYGIARSTASGAQEVNDVIILDARGGGGRFSLGGSSSNVWCVAATAAATASCVEVTAAMAAGECFALLSSVYRFSTASPRFGYLPACVSLPSFGPSLPSYFPKLPS